MKKLFFLILFSFLLVCPQSFASDYTYHWAAEEIGFAFENRFVSGDETGAFHPDRPVTRSEFTTLIVRYCNLFSSSLSTTMKDITPDSWYYPYLVIAEANQVIFGTEDGYFYPDANISRQDAIAILCRAYRIQPSSEQEQEFFYHDQYDIASYAIPSFFFSLRHGLISGYEDGFLRPEQPLTRAETVVLLNRFYQNSQTLTQAPEFFSGYPKVASSGVLNSINIAIKTNTPCTIYYKAIDAGELRSGVTPGYQELTDKLLTVTEPGKELFASIPTPSDSAYHLFFVAVTDAGLKSKVKRISTVMPLIYNQGNGTVENPYLIYNEYQLDYIRYFPDKHFRLANDIRLEKEWIPIDAEDGFSGSLDGAGHTISNLLIRSTENNVGFFSVLSGGQIRNLMLCGDVEGKNNVGIFAGTLKNATLRSCVATGFVKATANQAGGLVGANYGFISDCVSAIYSVEAISYAGGICGVNYSGIRNSLSAVYQVFADIYSGGIAAINVGGEISDCLAANITVQDIITSNSGRITTNKQGGQTLSNYSYERMKTTASGSLPDENNQNGIDVPWAQITSREFYQSVLEWDFSSKWRMPNLSSHRFLLPFPAVFSDIILEDGLTPYSPKRLTSYEELLQIHPQMHYILTKDIRIPDGVSWEPICNTSDPMLGFYGTFDGNGHTISNLSIPYSETGALFGFFGTIGDGIVKNLNLDNVQLSGRESIGALAAQSYGTVENCSAKVQITIPAEEKKSISCGGLIGKNYGIIQHSQVHGALDIFSISSNAGGIVGQNEGFVNDVAFLGKIHIHSDLENSTTSVGGICGYQDSGSLYHCFTQAEFLIESCHNYTGGICGILNSGEIYKTSATGRLTTKTTSFRKSVSYTGGICGLSVSGLLVHSFSQLPIRTESTANYTGGISGYNETCNIQNTYSLSAIEQTGGANRPKDLLALAGGICGYNETGFVSQNVAINEKIATNGTAHRICAQSQDGYLFENYASDAISLPLTANSPTLDGSLIPAQNLRNKTFFSLPVSKGGLLGWSSDQYNGDDGVWLTTSLANPLYPYPVLTGVRYQQNFSAP